MSESSWEQLSELLAGDSLDAVLAWIRVTPERERRAAFAPLKKHLDQLDYLRNVELFVAAVAGCAPTAKQAATALTGSDMSYFMTLYGTRIPPGLVADILREREAAWIGQLAHQLAARLNRGASWSMVDELLQVSGAETPTGENFVAGWIESLQLRPHYRAKSPDPYLGLRDSRYTAVLLPQLFVHDRLGRHIEDQGGGGGFRSALVRLADEDPAVREMLLAGCRSRLLRGGTPGQLRGYTKLHDELAPIPAEAAQGVGEYLRLLECGNSTVAGMALRMLRLVDEDGALAWDTLREAAQVALARPEKTLVKAQTTWLRQVAKRRPDRAAEVAELIEGGAVPGDELVAMPLPAPVVASLPPAIVSIAELSEELHALIVGGDWSTPTVERVMAALVRFRHRDPAALKDTIVALQKAIGDQVHLELALALAGAVGRFGDAVQQRQYLREVVIGTTPLPLYGDTRGPHMLLKVRLAELGRQMHRQTPVPKLVSTPTLTNGLLDPQVLLDRLRQAEDGGWQPFELDLEQALLRLPREIDSAVPAAAATLSSPAGRRLAQWLRDGVPDPVSLPYDETYTPTYQWQSLPERGRLVALEAPPTGTALTEVVFKLPRESLADGGYPWHDPQTWAAALPSHREVVAAWALPAVAAHADRDHQGYLGLLPLLAECTGPVGPAMTLGVAYGLCACAASDRVAAVDAAMMLAATGDLDCAAIGRHVGEYGAAGILKVNRLAASLGELARAGAVAQVWDIAVAALSALATAGRARPGVSELVTVAGQAGRAIGVRELPPQLRDPANVLASTARHLRRLADQLSGDRPVR